MRVSATWLCLLLQTATIAVAKGNSYNGKSQGSDHGGKPETKGELLSQSLMPEARQPGAALVDAAHAELKKIPPSTFQRSKGQKSIFTTLFELLLYAIPTSPVAAPTSGSNPPTNGHLSSAVELLERAALQNNSDALFILADLNLYGNYSHPRNLRTAFSHYSQLAADYGNSTAQYMLGLFYSTGIGDVVVRDQAKALLYYTFSAAKGDPRAEMATGYRHHSGIGTKQSCENAIKFYKDVATKAIEWYRSGPPGDRSWIGLAWRITDDDGGIYGEGASASSSGSNAWRPSVHSDAHAAIGDKIEYLDLMSQKGDLPASFSLGRIYYEGWRGLDRDFALARKYLFMVVTRYWKRDGRLVENHKSGIEKIAGKAAGYLGRMYLRGDGVTQNFQKARDWFEKGISLAEAQSQYGLGIMLLNGYGGSKNVKKAMELLRVSAEQDYAPAQVQVGKLYLDQGSHEDVRIAANHFELAARHGHLEAYFYLAEILYHGVGREQLCGQALQYYKIVAEKAEPLISSWQDANDAYEAGELETAFIQYLMAAEQGYEKAQTNVAFMLDPMRSKLPLLDMIPRGGVKKGLLQDPELALIEWTRSSRQSNVDALVKMGDYYFYGIGTEPDISKAVTCYTGASDYSQSAQALFNLGWMHENGIGLKQDFHLAKRYYDQALEVNVEAYLPVTLSLLKLRVRSAWNTLTNGGIDPIRDDPKVKKDWSLSEWITNFMQDDDHYWYDDDDDSFNNDYYDGAIASDDDGFDDAGILESMLIIGITTSLVLLLWWRQRIQQANAQNNGEVRGRDQGHQAAGQQPGQANGRDNAFGLGNVFPGWAANGAGL